MADHVIHISKEEAARYFAGVLERVRAGAEVVIESDARAVAIVRPAGDEFRPRLLSESIALAKKPPKSWATSHGWTRTSPLTWKRSSRAADR